MIKVKCLTCGSFDIETKITEFDDLDKEMQIVNDRKDFPKKVFFCQDCFKTWF